MCNNVPPCSDLYSIRDCIMNLHGKCLSQDIICIEATFRDLINNVWLLKCGSFNLVVNQIHFKAFPCGCSTLSRNRVGF